MQGARFSSRALAHCQPRLDGLRRPSGCLCGATPGSLQQNISAGKKKKKRLDEACTEAFPGHELKAIQSWILQGKVSVGGTVSTKAGALVSNTDNISLNVVISKYVNRAGQKLEAALQHFEIDVTGKTALDAGISTGGFTDCLLQHGATRVIGVDTGYAKVSEKLRTDPRLHLLERTNLRHLLLSAMPNGQPVDIVTLDLSFISLLTVMPTVAQLVHPSKAELVTLIKPQFEAARNQVGAGGIVSDPAVHAEVLHKVVQGTEKIGFRCIGSCESPVRGAVGGNKEFLAYFKRP